MSTSRSASSRPGYIRAKLKMDSTMSFGPMSVQCSWKLTADFAVANRVNIRETNQGNAIELSKAFVFFLSARFSSI